MATLSFDVLWKDHGAERGMKNLGDRSEKLRGRLKAVGVAGGVALAAVGVAATKFAISSVKAYAEAETSQLRLSEAYRKFPKLADTSISSLRQLNTELARKTRFDDDATASGQAVLAQFNLTGKQITQLTPLLQDYAARTGKDLPTAAKDLGKAVLGQGRALKNVGLNFKDTGSQAGNLEQITKGLRKQVGGFAEKEGKTAAGQSEILKNQWGELQEAVGAKLLPQLMKLAKWVSTHQEQLVTMFVDIAKGGIQFGISLGKVLSVGLKGFAGFADGIGIWVGASITWFQGFLIAATKAFSWLPGIGPQLVVANASFGAFAANARANTFKTGNAVRGLAHGIDSGLIPTLTKAGRTVDEVGRKEIVKARTRDAVARAAQTVRGYDKDLRNVKPGVDTKVTTPGLHQARHGIQSFDKDINNLNNKTVRINYSTNAYDIARKYHVSVTGQGSGGGRARGGILPGFTPLSRGDDIAFPMATGGIQPLRGGEGITVSEAMRNPYERARLHAINSAALSGQSLGRFQGLAAGGLVRSIGVETSGSGGLPAFGVLGSRVAAAVASSLGPAVRRRLEAALAGAGGGGAFGGAGAFGVGHLAQAALARVGQAWDIGTCLRFVRMMAGAPGGTYDATAAWHNARYKHRGDRNAPSGVPMYWGGGHGHIAVSVGGGRIVGTDFPRTGRIGLASAARLTSAWGKPYLGWANDVNGVITSRYGMRQNRGVSGGYSSGGMVYEPSLIAAGERGPERVLSAAQTRTFDRMVRVMDSRGAGNTYVVNMSLPNYLGSRQEMRKAMVDMVRSGAFEVIKR